ncbi:MAG: ATP-binding protein, partial [Xanthomonadaceae bacterium]|nr:ATP-binding protein [Xanthomonadaceae bacterium]
RSLPALLCNQLQDALQRMSGIRQRQAPVREALRVLAGFVGSLRPRYRDINIIMDLKPEPGVADSGMLEVDLTSLFEAIGVEAAQAGTAYAILIDDMHSVEARQLSALIGALHRIAQRGLPVVMIGAGSQILRRRIGNAKPYAERMFEFVDLGG